MAKKKSVKRNASKSIKPDKKWHAVPLKGSFMATAILGFLISAYWVYPQSLSYGVTFMIIFGAMFIASLISMTKAPVVEKGEYFFCMQALLGDSKYRQPALQDQIQFPLFQLLPLQFLRSQESH